jgi:hypothetical protein
MSLIAEFLVSMKYALPLRSNPVENQPTRRLVILFLYKMLISGMKSSLKNVGE